MPQLVSSRDGTQTHVCLTPVSIFLTTVVFCPGTRLFSKCQDPYIGFSFLYLGLDRLNLKASSILGFASGSLSPRTCDIVSYFYSHFEPVIRLITQRSFNPLFMCCLVDDALMVPYVIFKSQKHFSHTLGGSGGIIAPQQKLGVLEGSLVMWQEIWFQAL